MFNISTSLLQGSPESSRLSNLSPLPLSLAPKLVWQDMQILQIALQKLGVLSTTGSMPPLACLLWASSGVLTKKGPSTFEHNFGLLYCSICFINLLDLLYFRCSSAAFVFESEAATLLGLLSSKRLTNVSMIQKFGGCKSKQHSFHEPWFCCRKSSQLPVPAQWYWRAMF